LFLESRSIMLETLVYFLKHIKLKKMKTKVIFLKEPFRAILAYFPESSESNGQRNDLKLCYSHVGQHSVCAPEYVNKCKEANYNEYSDLLKELIGQGYKLQVLNNQVIELHRQPTEYELKFGHGATHYRDFLINDVLNKKGELKKWIAAKDEKVRYYR
jgi:hypothetical protein